jgi:hypothetical protein
MLFLLGLGEIFAHAITRHPVTCAALRKWSRKEPAKRGKSFQEALVMGIEIPGGPAGTGAVSGIDQLSEAEPSPEAAAIGAVDGPASGDAVARVAEDLAAGRISGDEAVEILLRDVMDDAMVKAAPESLRTELAETLSAMIATDPHLASLARSLGADPER